ncbi:MAG: nuclear transport factor 2 family protein [Nitrospinaceae bacterium]
MQATSHTVAEIQSVLDQFQESYGRKDVRTLLDLFVPDPDVTVIGTGVDEMRTGREEIKTQLERDFCQSDHLSLAFDNVIVSQLGPVCWVAGDSRVDFTVQGRERQVSLRFSAVLENRKGPWLFVQIHFSLPYKENSVLDSFSGSLRG